jgi:cytoskeleton protein RodZ
VPQSALESERNAPQPAPADIAPAPATPTSSTPTATSAPIRVRLEFTGESWTEIYDATGARLLFGMGTPQRVRTLVGVPPIQVNLGAASAVSVQVNGESVVIPRREGRESARFTIDADGNLR